jgi:uncharacterized membrane protein
MTIWLVITAICSIVATFGFLYWIGALRPERARVRNESADSPLFFEIFRAKAEKEREKNDF